ncbi:MAG: transglutaminase-like domain-containing protein [Planctomycetota bacterium]
MTESHAYVRRLTSRFFGLAFLVCVIFTANPASSWARPLMQQEAKSAPGANAVTAADGVVTGESVQQAWRVGVLLKGGPDETRNILATIPLPGDWPEQKVRVIGKEAPAEVTKLSIRDTLPNFQQIVAVVPSLRPQQELKVTYDVQVTLYKINAPATTAEWKIPKSLSKELKDYLDISPGISFRDAKLRAMVKELTKDKETAWDQVRALYEWVQAEIKPEGGDPTDTLDCFRKRAGHAEDICGLFVAMCRAHKVPARMVWVIESQHTEFYLVDEQGKGRWFPVVFGGFSEFGSLSSPKLIEMTGDSFRVPEKKEPQKYVFENVTGEASTRPSVGFIREMIPGGVGKGGSR